MAKITVEELLLRWEDLQQAGKSVSVDDLCRDCPDLRPQLLARIRALKMMNQVLDLSNGEKPALKPGRRRTRYDDLRSGWEPVPGYRLEKQLGKGGFGEVWKAIGPGGFPVALKFVPLASQLGASERRSLEIIKTVRHPNLLGTFGAWEVHGFLVIAMELADRTLFDRLQEATAKGESGIPRDELFQYMQEAAKGIDYLNQPSVGQDDNTKAAIQHRDIKPQNIFLMGGGVKVGDFGLLRTVRNTETRHSGFLTVAFAAPEFFTGHTSRSSDQYSLAVTYCQLRSGRLPFKGNLALIMASQLLEDPDLSMLPESERPAVVRALSKKPEDRWPSCVAFIEALREGSPANSASSEAKFFFPSTWLEEHITAQPASAQPTLPKAKSEASKRLVLIVGGSVLFLLLVGCVSLVAWFFRGEAPKKNGTVRITKTKWSTGDEKLIPGKHHHLLVWIERVDFKGPVTVSLKDLPKGVVSDPLVFPPNKDSDQIRIVASIGTEPLTVPIRVVAECEEADAKAEIPMTLTVKEDPWKLKNKEDPKKQTSEADLLLEQGRKHLIENKNDLAFDVLSTAINKDPSLAWAYVGRAEASSRLGKNDLAIADCNEAIRLSPPGDNDLLWAAFMWRGHAYRNKQAYHNKQDLNQAIDSFTEAIKRLPKNGQGYFWRGHAYRAKKDLDGSIAEFSKAIELAPSDDRWLLAVAFENRAHSYREKGKPFADKAIDDYTASLKYREPDGFLFYCRGVAYALKGDLKSAQRDKQQAKTLGYTPPK